MSEETVPAWAGKLGEEGFKLMSELVSATLRRKGAEHPEGPWTEPRLRVRAPQRGVVEVDLQEWAEVLSHAPRESWRKMVGHLVRVRLAGGEEVVDFNDFSSVKDRVRVRLSRSAEQADETGTPVVTLPVMPGLDAVLTVDLPEEIVLVTPDQVTSWGIDTRSAFALGLYNTVQEEITQEKLTLEDGVVLYAWTGESQYIASRGLALERWLDNKRGAFVAVPTRNLLLFHPIQDEHALSAVYDLWATAQEPFKHGGPHALSGDVYWWTPGRFTRVEVVVQEETQSLEARLPPDLMLALQGLMEEPS